MGYGIAPGRGMQPYGRGGMGGMMQNMMYPAANLAYGQRVGAQQAYGQQVYSQQQYGGQVQMGMAPAAVAKGQPGCNVFIFGLPDNYQDRDLQQLFSPFGAMASATVNLDRVTGLSKGFGFVSYHNADDAAKAIQTLDGLQMGPKRLVVRLKKGEEGASRSMGGGGGMGGIQGGSVYNTGAGAAAGQQTQSIYTQAFNQVQGLVQSSAIPQHTYAAGNSYTGASGAVTGTGPVRGAGAAVGGGAAYRYSPY